MNRLSMKSKQFETVINGFDFAIRGLYFRIVNNKFNLLKKRSMINYSTYMWKSPLDETAKEQAYAKNQVTKVMSFDDFVKHISDHNGVFTRGTVKGVVSDTCSCLVEQLLNGYKVQFGELGIFSISITCEPAATLKDFSSDNIKAVNILFNPGIDFENLRSKAEFNLVTSRAIQAASLKAVKENKDTVDLAALKKGDSESPDEI